jgi:hypothetical protein
VSCPRRCLRRSLLVRSAKPLRLRDLHPERRSDPECVVSASFATGCVPSPTVNGASTRPWTGMYTFVKDDTQYELVEYACHEGNYGMFNILTGSRAKEREADSQR